MLKNIKFLKSCEHFSHGSSIELGFCDMPLSRLLRLPSLCHCRREFTSLYFALPHNVQKKNWFYNKKNRAQKNLCRGAFRLPNYYLPILFWRQPSFLCGSRIQNFIQIAPYFLEKNTKLPCDALRNFAFEQCIIYAFPRRSVFLLGIESELLLS